MTCAIEHWALHYLGKPWVSGAAGPEAYDCYGLVRAVYRDRFGLDLPAIEPGITTTLACARAVRDYADYSHWDAVPPDAPRRECDVLQMGSARHPHHVGLWIDGGRVLHCVSGAGVLLQTPSSLWVHGWNILNVYRRSSA